MEFLETDCQSPVFSVVASLDLSGRAISTGDVGEELWGIVSDLTLFY